MRRQTQQLRSAQSFRNRIAYQYLEFQHPVQEEFMTIYNEYPHLRFTATDLERHPQIHKHTATEVTDREPLLQIRNHIIMAVTARELLPQVHKYIKALDQEHLLQLHQDTTAMDLERLLLLLPSNTFLIQENLRHQNQILTLGLLLHLLHRHIAHFINLRALFNIGPKAIIPHERNRHVRLLLVVVLD
jgi:hypothetical protein